MKRKLTSSRSIPAQSTTAERGKGQCDTTLTVPTSRRALAALKTCRSPPPSVASHPSNRTMRFSLNSTSSPVQERFAASVSGFLTHSTSAGRAAAPRGQSYAPRSRCHRTRKTSNSIETASLSGRTLLIGTCRHSMGTSTACQPRRPAIANNSTSKAVTRSR